MHNNRRPALVYNPHTVPSVRSDDAEISYEVLGNGSPVVLLHPFPAHHELWIPAAQSLMSRYRIILPDLRGHGVSGVGDGPATMEKHAADLLAILEAEHIARCPFAGNSIGGYALFELWRRARSRVTTLILINTKAQADTPEARANRLKSATDVLDRGTELFFQTTLPKLLGQTTYNTRPDLVDGAMRMLQKMSAEDVAQVQRGMADRPDSVSTLNTINVPTLIITGDEDSATGVPDAELMHQHIAGSRLAVIPKAGHYSPWEQPKEVGRLLRGFLDETSGP